MSKILIVDDEVEICEFLEEFFVDRDYEVVTASSGEEALAKIIVEQPDVLLLDVKMPGIDGIEVLKNVKRMYPALKVIMVTAVETADKIKEALALGADNYITKPLSLEYLERDVEAKLVKIA